MDKVKGHLPHIIHVLDYFVFIGQSRSEICKQNLFQKAFGVPVKEVKDYNGGYNGDYNGFLFVLK